MEQKLAELTEVIYKEGVEKGEAEANRIIEEAKAKATSIIDGAKKEAESIHNKASADAEELRRNTNNEIKLAGQQAIGTIQQKILDSILLETVDTKVESLLSDPAVIKEFVATALKAWTQSPSAAPSCEIILPENTREELEKSLEQAVHKLLKQGVNVSFSKAIKGGFQIHPAEGKYKISMTSDDFSEFFKAYLRPRTRTLLFGE